MSVLGLCAVLAAHSMAVAYEVYSLLEPADRVFGGAAIAMVFVICDTAAWGLGRRAARAIRRERELETERDEVAAQAVREERLRIARELHDIVAHSVTVMILQAAAGRTALPPGRSAARDAMDSVQVVGQQAIAEMHRLLAVLRSIGSDEPVVDPDGLHAIAGLLMQFRGVGVNIDLHTSGVPATVDRSVELAAYRVLQEGLTNITKHAGPGTAVDVAMHWSPAELSICITDDGAGRASAEMAGAPGGLGLVGLAERVSVVGGRLECGPLNNGFRLAVSLPTSAASLALPPSPHASGHKEVPAGRAQR